MTLCSLTLLGLVLPTILALLSMTGCGAVQAAVDPQPAIAALLQTEQGAWNVNDAAAYASAYTVDADFVNIRGHIFTGRPAIAQVAAQIFAGPFKASTIKITIRLFTQLAPGVVMVDTQQDVTNYVFLPPGIVATKPGILTTYLKYIAEQQADGSWKFISSQNTSVL